MVKRVYTDYIQDIFDSINDIEHFIEGMNFNAISLLFSPMDALVLDKQISLSKYKNQAATPHLNWLFFYSLLFSCQIIQGDESGHEMP